MLWNAKTFHSLGSMKGPVSAYSIEMLLFVHLWFLVRLFISPHFIAFPYFPPSLPPSPFLSPSLLSAKFSVHLH